MKNITELKLGEDFLINVDGWGKHIFKMNGVTCDPVGAKLVIDASNEKAKATVYFIAGQIPNLWQRIRFLFKPVPIVTVRKSSDDR